MRKDITDVLISVGSELLQGGGIESMEIAQGHDIHAFYRKRNLVVHIQAYPGFSTSSEMIVTGRRMQYDKMLELRARGASPGNEHEAAAGQSFGQTRVPYDSSALMDGVLNLLL